jgi:HEAT repeats
VALEGRFPAPERVMWCQLVIVALTSIGLVAAHATAQPIADFVASDAASKQRILNDIAASRSRVAIVDVITVARAGMHDPVPEVRVAALAAVAGRAMASRWAGTSGPLMGPLPDGSLSPRGEPIPAEWLDDQRNLHEAVAEDCSRLLLEDQNQTVREYALLALGNLESPSDPNEPLRPQFIELLVNVFYNDADARIRAAVVKALTLIPNNSDMVRAVLRDGLVDPQAAVRHEALTGLTPQALGGRSKVSYEEARATFARALEHADPEVRLGAVQALNVFGASASEYIGILERLQQTDGNAQVRTSAGLAIAAIQRGMR